jgi:Iron-sulfur cluster-binding domain
MSRGRFGARVRAALRAVLRRVGRGTPRHAPARPRRATEERLFCSRPFTWLEVQSMPRGETFLCCPTWLPRSTGNLLRDPIGQVWNGSAAQALRASILDGSFRFCTEDCPFLRTQSGPVCKADEIREPEMRDFASRGVVVLPRGPLVVNCAYDRSCNLSCPSCRTHVIVERENASEIEAVREAVASKALPDAEVLYITGSGDAFGSPHFNRWLRSGELAGFPRLKTIHLHTNGLLWKPRMWAQIPVEVRMLIRSAEISIDAAESSTYAANRRGGRFEDLLESLSFISSLRSSGHLRYLKLHMVVQKNNYREMGAFVELGKRYGADTVYFSHLQDWGTFGRSDLAVRSVTVPGHPEQEALRVHLLDPVFQDGVVDLGNLAHLAPVMPPRRSSIPPDDPLIRLGLA